VADLIAVLAGVQWWLLPGFACTPAFTDFPALQDEINSYLAEPIRKLVLLPLNCCNRKSMATQQLQVQTSL
jgi:hypothetical protein